jgi:multiple sugar transport system substrate-binding protein
LAGKLFCTIVTLLSVFAFAIGCTEQEKAGDEKQAAAETTTGSISKEPITITIYQGGAIAEDEFQRTMADPVKKKFPNITLEMVRKERKLSHPDMMNKLVTAGNFPDMIFIDANALNMSKELGLQFDLTPFVKKYKLDLNRFEPVGMKMIKSFSDNGELFAIPFSRGFGALYYNKDIFDKFGVPYPKNDLFWEDAIELGKKVNRTADGINYKGLAPGDITFFASGLSLPVVDPKTNRAAIATDAWKRIFELFTSAAALNDNSPGGNFPFMEDRNVAMLAAGDNIIGNLGQMQKEGNPMNWDMASYPSFKENPGRDRGARVQSLAISSTGKHKDEAFQVILYLTGEEHQLKISREGSLSALNDPRMKEEFGKEVEVLNGKNIKGVLKNPPADPVPPNKYEDLVNDELKKIVGKVLSGTTDINSALREAEEAANKAIADEKAK